MWQNTWSQTPGVPATTRALHHQQLLAVDKNLAEELYLRKLDSFRVRTPRTAGTYRCTFTACQPRTAPAGSQRSSAQFAPWVHVSAAHRRSEHSVDGLDLRHHPEEHLGMLEHSLQDYKDVHKPKDLVHEALLNPVQGEDLEGPHEELRPSPAAPPLPPDVTAFTSSISSKWRGPLPRQPEAPRSSNWPRGVARCLDRLTSPSNEKTNLMIRASRRWRPAVHK